jgi:hypothetical protein
LGTIICLFVSQQQRMLLPQVLGSCSEKATKAILDVLLCLSKEKLLSKRKKQNDITFELDSIKTFKIRFKILDHPRTICHIFKNVSSHHFVCMGHVVVYGIRLIYHMKS